MKILEKGRLGETYNIGGNSEKIIIKSFLKYAKF